MTAATIPCSASPRLAPPPRLPRSFELSADCVAAFCADLAAIPVDESVLPHEERRLCVSLPAQRRAEFVRGRVLLRTVLSGCLGVPPASVRLQLRGGKPVLEGWDLGVSLSHSHRLAACAVAPDREVGVDVEPIEPWSAAIARRCFLPGERRLLERSAVKDAAFARIWTLKEAVVKASGGRLLQEVVRVDVTRLGADVQAFSEIVEGEHALAVAVRSGGRPPLTCTVTRLGAASFRGAPPGAEIAAEARGRNLPPLPTWNGG